MRFLALYLRSWMQAAAKCLGQASWPLQVQPGWEASASSWGHTLIESQALGASAEGEQEHPHGGIRLEGGHSIRAACRLAPL